MLLLLLLLDSVEQLTMGLYMVLVGDFWRSLVVLIMGQMCLRTLVVDGRCGISAWIGLMLVFIDSCSLYLLQLFMLTHRERLRLMRVRCRLCLILKFDRH